jgi:hypothetical protein
MGAPGNGLELHLTFITALQTCSCLSLEVAGVINEMIVLWVKQMTCAWQCAARTDVVTSLSQQLSHGVKAIFGDRSYTFSPWFRHQKEIFAMAYFLWEMVASIRFKSNVLWSYLFCKWLWNIACRSEKQTDWRWGLQSSAMFHRVTECMVTDVSGRSSGPIFKVEMSKTKKSSSPLRCQRRRNLLLLSSSSFFFFRLLLLSSTSSFFFFLLLPSSSFVYFFFLLLLLSSSSTYSSFFFFLLLFLLLLILLLILLLLSYSSFLFFFFSFLLLSSSSSTSSFFFFFISTTWTAEGKSIVWNEGCVNCFKILFLYLISGTEEDQEQII